MIQIIPALFVAPLFIAGEVEFGVITQSAMAFTMLLGAFSLIITQFQSISSFTAVVARLSSLGEAVEKLQSTGGPAIEIREEEGRVAYEGVTLLSPEDDRPLLRDLSVSVPSGKRVLILGGNGEPKTALFKATAGIWNKGEGRIMRPGGNGMVFLAERPYVPPGTLREVITPTVKESRISDEGIVDVFRAMNLEPIVARAGGLDREQDWGTALSLSEQKLLAFIRVLLSKPQSAFLERPGTSLSPEQVKRILGLLSNSSIGYLTIGEAADPLDLYDAVLEIAEDGAWTWKELKP
jgi:putative ATP-binding cassette transporter